MAIEISFGDIVASAALLLSGYANWKTFKFNERQKSLIESQEKLNNLLFVKEEQETESIKKAELGTTFVKIGSNGYKLKVWNKGKSSAKNVRIEFPEGNGVLIHSDIESKFPLETLDRHQSVELIASVCMGSKSKHVIKLIWDDEYGNDNEKITYPTI